MIYLLFLDNYAIMRVSHYQRYNREWYGLSDLEMYLDKE